MDLKIGNQLTVTISDLSRGGAGVAKTEDGKTIFVPYTITGDVVSVEITEIKRRHVFAKLLDIINPSTERQAAQCSVFTQCGGCQWQHVPYTMQWATKVNGVRQSLAAAGIKNKFSLQEFPAQTLWHYRNRIQMRGKANELGFYAARSHDIVSISECAIARPEINQVLNDIRSQGSEYNKAYKVEIEVTSEGNIKSYWNAQHAAGGFRQVNDEQNQKLIHWIQKNLADQQAVYDLYGGSANLSWTLATSGIEVHCVDQSTPDNQPGQQPDTLQFYNEDVLSWLKKRVGDLMYKRIPSPSTPWAAIIDPPRGGMGEDFGEIIERLDKLKVNTIVLVGCKTDTWARDIFKLMQRSWEIKSLAVFDFFPHTPHVECVAKLVYTNR
ncbi:class I SAM-dependent RNA methyltransferase [Kaarinaea lacus]